MKEIKDATQEEFVERYARQNEGTYWFLRSFFYPVEALLFHTKIYGKENIPDGPVVMVSNHRYAADPASMVKASTKRPVRFLAKKDLYEGPFGFLYDWFLTVPVDRSRHAPEVMAAADIVLQNDGIIGIFPEGTRNKTDEILLPFKFGAVKLAQENDAWILPCVNVGRSRPVFSNTELHIGEPYKIAADADLEAENEKLRQIIYDMYVKYGKQDERLDKIRNEKNGD